MESSPNQAGAPGTHRQGPQGLAELCQSPASQRQHNRRHTSGQLLQLLDPLTPEQCCNGCGSRALHFGMQRIAHVTLWLN